MAYLWGLNPLYCASAKKLQYGGFLLLLQKLIDCLSNCLCNGERVSFTPLLQSSECFRIKSNAETNIFWIVSLWTPYMRAHKFTSLSVTHLI